MADSLLERVRDAEWARRTGTIARIVGTTVESRGPDAVMGELCHVGPRGDLGRVHAEVVGLRDGHVLLMPYGQLQGVSVGTEVEATGSFARAAVGPGLLGRVWDGLGAPLDGGPALAATGERPLHPPPLNPLHRMGIRQVLETGVKAIDTLLPLGRGQRIGVFAGSGVGKSTLIEMITRGATADVNVIALIGERGREASALVESLRETPAWQRTVVVVATSDEPALVRRRAAFLATAIAEYFCDEGRQVCLTMDSVTRLAMAQREIGLAGGELPTARGFTPSVFDLLPRLLERGGARRHGGTLTGLYTVLVDGDDMAEPVADSLRAILDGHIVLSRDVAHRGRFPAIDVTRSVSRLAASILTEAEQRQVRDVTEVLATYEAARDLVEVGAYKDGANPAIDRAIRLMPQIEAFLRQSPGESVARAEAVLQLARSIAAGAVPP